MTVTEKIFKSFLSCPYKAQLLLHEHVGVKSEYETVLTERETQYRTKALKRISVEDISPNTLGDGVCNGWDGGFYQTKIETNGMTFSSCVVNRVKGGSALGSFHYVPLMFSSIGKLSTENKLILAYAGLILESFQARPPDYGLAIQGETFKIAKVRIGDQIEKAKKVVSCIKRFASNPPRQILNQHCHVCEFASVCRAKAMEKDDLSLLAGIPLKEIEAQNKKGIFTVTQYSYTFRPRKKFRKAYPFNLKALALREKKVHLYGTPAIPTSSVQIYLDVEGDPERDFYYLIGVVIVENDVEKKHSFWADSEDEEKAACLSLVNCIRSYGDYKLYHYGSYETKFLQRVQSYANEPDDIRVIKGMLENAVNVLSIVYKHVFFPTYSNGLKDIGEFLGFKWTAKNASGINSLVWRTRYEQTKDDHLKKKLLEYNLEDCLALKHVTNFINMSISPTNNETNMICADNLKDASKFKKWGSIDFLWDDLKYINQCAYFDYQRERVFFRTNKNLKSIKKTGRFQEKRSYRINEKFKSNIHRKCPYCSGKLYRNGDGYIRTIFDLKFLSSGIKRWITTYETTGMRCFPCRKFITFESFKGISKYGHNLISWVNYQNIVGHQPFYRIQQLLDDLYGLSVSGTTLHRFKNLASEYYKETYQSIIQKIKQSKLVHIDETQISFPEVNGYVWVFTNMEEVVFIYRATREGEFLKELLNDFKGVLISDFYSAYCCSEWIQQKCLIHLIRDLNDDLRSSPFDEEYKTMAKKFSSLLSKIVTTIDKYGLKKRNLSQHKKDVSCFFHDLFRQQYQSELAQKYQKRFQKNEDTLFTFLDYDGVPWNNNNAEHAIKFFADFRRIMRKGGNFTEKGLKEYLVLLSVYQTCQYKGLNFLKFLISKEKDIESYSKNKSVRRNLALNQFENNKERAIDE